MKKLMILTFCIAFSLAIFSCAKKANKEQALDFYTKMNEYVASPEFGKEFASTLDAKDSVINIEKTEKSINTIVLAQENKVAQSMGFKSAEDFTKDESLFAIAEVKAANEKFKKNIMMHSHLIMMGQNPANGLGGMEKMHGGGMGMPPHEPAKTDENVKK